MSVLDSIMAKMSEIEEVSDFTQGALGGVLKGK